jgi:hypothetical protein
MLMQEALFNQVTIRYARKSFNDKLLAGIGAAE